MSIPLDFVEWPSLPSPLTKWIIAQVYPPVADLAAGDEVYFELLTTIPTSIKIKDVVCTHGGTHSGASWKGMKLTGGGPRANGTINGTSVSIEIVSSYPGHHHLDCNGTSGSVGSACWTADAG